MLLHQPRAMMDSKTLFRKYEALLAENKALKEENLSLKARLGLADPVESLPCPEGIQQELARTDTSFHLHAKSDPREKIKLFMSLFKGRDDLYARRWESRDGGSGYAPVCLNEWKPGLCRKPEVRCSSCRHRSFAALDRKVVEAHLKGRLVAGVYPLLQDEKCHFLAIDFDKEGWQQDVAVLRDVCEALDIPVAIERSRSGHGAHAWFFFTDPIAASLAHVKMLAGRLREKIPDVTTLTGGRKRKDIETVLQGIAQAPAGVQLTLVATGRYIGEGFDEARLDTLFLAMPISWKGTLQQYAGRLHRLFEGKREVQIYDYIDIHVGALERMYRKRLSGYAGIGYRTKAESFPNAPAEIIFDDSSFLPVFQNDMMSAAREAVIVSPFVTRRRAPRMLPTIQAALANGVAVTVVTRPTSAYKDKDRPILEETLAVFRDVGAHILFKANIHQKFAVMDQKITWYGSINLLSYGSAQESIMRLESPNIAHELMKYLGIHGVNAGGPRP